MLGRREENKTGSWKHRNGNGLFYLITAAMLLITIVVWRSGQSWRGAVLGLFLLLAAFLLFVGQQNSAVFDVDRRHIYLSQRRIWKKAERVIPFDDVHTVAVVSSSLGTTSRTHKVTLVLKSGEPVQVTAHPSSGKRPKLKLAQQISDTLNQYRSQPISPALEGIVKVVRKGENQAVSWRVDLLSANDMVPVTRWFCQAASFKSGFLLLFPTSSIGNPGPGKLSKTTRFFYRQYLRTLMVDDKTIPGFQDAAPLQNNDHPLGSQFTCISNDPQAARSWLTKSRSDNLIHWLDNPPIKAKKGELAPHLLVTPDGIQIMFRKLYYQDQDIQKITDFGISLIAEY